MFLIPALWAGGTVLLLGGGYWLAHTYHWFG